MKTVRDHVIEDARNLPRNAATREGVGLLHLPMKDESYYAANLYIAALEIIRGIIENIDAGVTFYTGSEK